MKIGDIKIEAIKLMFVNYAFDMGIEDLQRMISDENYGSYIVNMNGSIARAIDRIENACIVPIKTKRINENELEVGNRFARFNLNNIKDLFLIDRVTAEYENGEYDGNVTFELEGSELLLDRAKADYRILYFPKIKFVDNKISDNEEISIPDNIARLIPYFIKSELFQEEEPALAADARNLFEACIDDLKRQNQNKQNYIKPVFSLE